MTEAPIPPLLELGGKGPVLHMAVANGFSARTYLPMLTPLMDQCRVVNLPPRPLWPDPPAPESIRSWDDFADDMLRGMDRYGLTDVVAMGHSLGGMVTLLAVLKEPQRFRAVVFTDPTFLPPAALLVIGVMQALGLEDHAPLAKAALRRRRHFEDAEDAFNRFRGKPFFDGWPDATLRLYTEHGLIPNPGGEGLMLRWSPEWEARVFATVYAHTWRIIRQLDGLLPVLAIRGQNTNTFLPASYRAMQRRVPSATYVEIKGHGHLFPHTAADQTSQIIGEWLQRL